MFVVFGYAATTSRTEPSNTVRASASVAASSSGRSVRAGFRCSIVDDEPPAARRRGRVEPPAQLGVGERADRDADDVEAGVEDRGRVLADGVVAGRLDDDPAREEEVGEPRVLGPGQARHGPAAEEAVEPETGDRAGCDPLPDGAADRAAADHRDGPPPLARCRLVRHP
jgi:hypothetical protein